MSNNEQLLDELRRLHNDLLHGSDGGCFDICGLVGQAAERIEGLEAEKAERDRRLEAAVERIAQLENLAEDLREDFVDYACSGVPNLAPYCKNKTKQCTDGRNWCNNTPGACKGFLPMAWRNAGMEGEG